MHRNTDKGLRDRSGRGTARPFVESRASASRVIRVNFYPGPDPSPTDSDPYPVDPAGSGPGRFASADPGAGLLNNQAYPPGSMILRLP